MSTHIPGRHIENMVKRFAHADAILPPGWPREAWQSYQDDPDGGRAVCRAIHRDNFNAAIERDAEDWSADER